MSNTETISTPSKHPTHYVYHVRDRNNGQKGTWTRIGAAWAHTDGQGFNVQFDCVPLDGRITLRVPSDKQD